MKQSKGILSDNKGYISKVMSNEEILINKINLFPFSDKYLKYSSKKKRDYFYASEHDSFSSEEVLLLYSS